MADELLTALNEAAQYAEAERQVTANVQDRPVVDPFGLVDNPGGETPVGEGVDNTRIEQAPGSQPPAVDVRADIPGPAAYDTGSSGDVFVPPPPPPSQLQATAIPLAPAQPVVAFTTGVPDIPAALPQEAPPEPNPGLTVDKAANGIFAVDAQTGELIPLAQSNVTAAGQVAGYLITVVNTGDQDLTGVSVSDSLANFGAITLISGDNDRDGVLDVGETWTYQAYHQFSQSEIDAGGNFDSDLNGLFDQFLNTVVVDTDQTEPQQDQATIPVVQSPLLSIDKAVISVDPGPGGDGLANRPGDVITYSVTVTNSGNQTLNNILVNDPLTGLNQTIASLAPGAQQVFTTTYTITQADINSNGGGDGDIDNTAFADSDQTDQVTDSESVPLVTNPLLSIDKQVVSVDPTGNNIADRVGDIITYLVVVTNSGNQTLSNVQVTDPLTGLNQTIASLAPGASQSFTTTYAITQADLNSNGGGDGDIDNTAFAVSPQAPQVSDSEVVPLSSSVFLSIDKQVISVDPTGNGIADAAGDVINYNIVITNSGNQTLTNVEVSDPLTGFTTTIPSLAPGASLSYPTSYILTQDDINTNGGGDGDIDNIATADSDQTGPVSDSEVVPLNTLAILSIDKQVVSVDPVTAALNGNNGIADKAGDLITYLVTVTNSGNQELTNVRVQDPLTDLSELIVSLAPGASQVFTTTYALTQDDLNTSGGGDNDIDNTATATSDQTAEVSDSAEVPLTSFALLSINKQVLSVDPISLSANGSNGIADRAGDVITYQVTVTNNGNQDLTNVQVDDPLTGLSELITSLAPGASQVFTTTYVLTQDDLNTKGGGDNDIDNTATADSDQTAEVTDSVEVPLTASAFLSIDKQVVSVDPISSAVSGSNGIADRAGDVITYQVTVTNSGNQDLTNVKVDDPLTRLSETIVLLAPGESQVFTTTYILTQDDLNTRGGGDNDIDNTATTDSDQTPEVSDSASVPLTTSALLSIDKQVVSIDPRSEAVNGSNGIADRVGDVITYQVTVTNSGNQVLTNVTVVDPLTGLNQLISSLAPGASETFLTTYKLTQNDLDTNGGGDGDIDNTASADSDQTPAVSDSATVPLATSALLSIDKQVVSVDPISAAVNGSNGIADRVGDVITYQVTVTNSGNQVLTNVTVVDPLTGLNQLISSLAPGASETFLTTYKLTQNDLDTNGGGDGDIDNTASADSDQTSEVSDSAAVLILATLQAVVDDEGLTFGIAGSTDSSDLNPTNTSPKTQSPENIYKGSLLGDGTLNFKEGQITKIGLETVTWNKTLIGDYVGKITTTSDASRLNTDLAKISLSGNNYTFTLLKNVLHAEGPTSEQLADTLATLVYEDSASVARSLKLVFNDDSPTLDVANTQPLAGQGLIANQAGATFIGTYNGQIGADQVSFAAAYALTWSNPTSGYALWKSADQTYYAVKSSFLDASGNLLDANNDKQINSTDAALAKASALFEVTLNQPSSTGQGTYIFKLLDPADPSYQNSGDLLSQFSNNNSPKPSFDIVKTNFNDQFSLLITATDQNGAPLEVKISNTDLGVGANAAKGSDIIKFDATSYASDAATSIDRVLVKMAPEGSFVFNSTVVYAKVYYEGYSTPDTFSGKTDAAGNLVIQVDETRSLDYFTLSLVDGSSTAQDRTTWKIDGLSIDYRFESLPDDYKYDFVVGLTDADKDSAVPDGFTIYVDGDADSAYAVGPISLDLNRDGAIDYLPAMASVSPLTDGFTALLASVSPADGLLAYDYDHNGVIDQSRELVLTQWGSDPSVDTDLQALAVYFDSNHDGKFDSSDMAWGSFGVWQDTNHDGIQQQAEFASLTDWGITQIALAYDADSSPSVAADGDVHIYGQLSVAYHDGFTGLAEDVAFVVQSPDPVVASDACPSDAATSASVDLHDLVGLYLNVLADSGDQDGNGTYDPGHSPAELAYSLDTVISDYLDTHGLDADQYAAIHQSVMDHLAHDINDLILGTDQDLSIDGQGHAIDDASVLAALDHHYTDLVDLHNTDIDSTYHDSHTNEPALV